MFKFMWFLSLLGVLSSLKEMTMEEKRVENALFAMVGEDPPNDVPLNHKDQTLHDMLITSVKAVKDSHVGRLPNETEPEFKKCFPCNYESVNKRMASEEDQTYASSNWLHFGSSEIVIFDFWRIRNSKGMIISCIAIFILGALFEGLKWYQIYFALHKKFKRKESFHLPVIVTVTDGRALKEDFKVNDPLVKNSKTKVSERPSPFSLYRVTQALLYIFQLCLAYLMVLIVMTYNVWLAMSVILGAGFGHWIVTAFCASNSNSEETNDNCH
uniref:Copper transport protein n=1 Tax=Caenorhabditis tropicalis TaxID=1561998 RepID=A0A1I7TZG9_9PELO